MLRFSELEKAIPAISQKMLIHQPNHCGSFIRQWSKNVAPCNEAGPLL
ncbi:MAG TPA: winged helix-turn-helix transcriptional regulator [Microvirga sp.]|nr:winged helix-turn-helix transcriptional regulator [Microvirga sp.]